MEIGAWLGLAEPRPIDALSVAFFTDALIPTPFMAAGAPAAAPTIDLTIHFRAVAAARREDAGTATHHSSCYAHMSSKLLHEGFFEEDGVVWAADGTVLAQSRQLGDCCCPSARVAPWLTTQRSASVTCRRATAAGS